MSESSRAETVHWTASRRWVVVGLISASVALMFVGQLPALEPYAALAWFAAFAVMFAALVIELRSPRAPSRGGKVAAFGVVAVALIIGLVPGLLL